MDDAAQQDFGQGPDLDINTLSFEEAFQRLSDMAQSLEDGGLTLADATACYTAGMSLVRRCNQLLDEAELKITHLKDSYAQPTANLDSAEDGILGWLPVSEEHGSGPDLPEFLDPPLE